MTQRFAARACDSFRPGELVRIGRNNTFLGARCWRSFPIDWSTRSIWLHDVLGIVLENCDGYSKILLLGDEFGKTWCWCNPIYLSAVESLDDNICVKQQAMIFIECASKVLRRAVHLAHHLNHQLFQ